MTDSFRITLQVLLLALVSMAAVVPAAHAQITITGPSNGFCSTQPGDPNTQANGPQAVFAYPLYGAGQIADPTCGSLHQVGNQQLFAGNGTGFNIVGNGNLQGLLIRVGSGVGSGFTANVWVTHNGVATLAITCTAAANTSGDVPDCIDTTTIAPVLDKDRVEIIVTGTPGDTYSNIAWYLGKS